MKWLILNSQLCIIPNMLALKECLQVESAPPRPMWMEWHSHPQQEESPSLRLRHAFKTQTSAVPTKCESFPMTLEACISSWCFPHPSLQLSRLRELLASSQRPGTRFVRSSLAASPTSTSCVLPFCSGAQSVPTSSLLRWLLLLKGLQRDHSSACKTYQISHAPSPFRAASHGTTCISLPSTSKSSPLESTDLCSAAGLPHCPLILGPHYLMVMTAKAGTDYHLPDQLFLVGQNEGQVSISLVGTPGSSTKKSSQEPPGCWHCVALPGQ